MRTKKDLCEYSDTRLDAAERRVAVYRHRRRKHFIFEQVPARVCSGCGERYFAARVVKAMQEMTARRRRPTVAVPVIALPRRSKLK